LLEEALLFDAAGRRYPLFRRLGRSLFESPFFFRRQFGVFVDGDLVVAVNSLLPVKSLI